MISIMVSFGEPVPLSRPGSMVVFATVLLGVVIGSISAYYGGWVDNILMRIVDVLLVLPFFWLP